MHGTKVVGTLLVALVAAVTLGGGGSASAAPDIYITENGAAVPNGYDVYDISGWGLAPRDNYFHIWSAGEVAVNGKPTDVMHFRTTALECFDTWPCPIGYFIKGGEIAKWVVKSSGVEIVTLSEPAEIAEPSTPEPRVYKFAKTLKASRPGFGIPGILSFSNGPEGLEFAGKIVKGASQQGCPSTRVAKFGAIAKSSTGTGAGNLHISLSP